MLKYVVVRCAASLAPVNMAREKDACIVKFTTCVAKLFKFKLVMAKEADDAKLQYKELLQTVHLKYKDTFSTFKYKDCRLRQISSFVFLNEESKYVAVWKVAKIILTSHGQSDVECGFSVNNEALKVNMQEKSLVSLHLIYDHLISSSIQKNLLDYTISAGLRKICSCAYARSREATEEKKKEEKKLKQTENENLNQWILQI